jgi:hypothetical protein
MKSPISSKAMILIHSALIPIIKSGKKIERIKMFVSSEADISSFTSIMTQFGELKIVPDSYVPKGYSYLMEYPISKGGVGFNWVSKPKKINPSASVGERPSKDLSKDHLLV